ncbi:MAG: M14 family zinc carboxypeptidase [Bacteroidota bacterium]
MRTTTSLLSLCLTLALISSSNWVQAQDYFLKDHGPFDSSIPTPAEFLGYDIGLHHTRYDRMVAYLEKLAELSPRASIEQHGMTYEYRPLVTLTISSEENLSNLDEILERHLAVVDVDQTVSDFSDLPVFVNLGYSVHGNEPSTSESALLAAYTLVASESAAVREYRENGVISIDPAINPDGRDRHTHWANMHKGSPFVSDPDDVEHNEAWPRGRTNHYWFDLNRDWWLAVHPESRGKLNWYHKWYPNVVADFHEMGTNSSYFFEPMKDNASKDPIMPKENYTTLNELFAKYFREDMDKIGSFYFTKEVFDGTYPGYGSSYPDLQGALALLFEQASSRGHLQETPTGDITFAFTIRNQYVSAMATVRAAVENKDQMYQYQQDFFKSAISNANRSGIRGYVFSGGMDETRTRAFIDKLLIHRVKVYELDQALTAGGKRYEPGQAFMVPTAQPQYRIVQSAFETYSEYTDSVYYDASAWSLANFYNMDYTGTNSLGAQGAEVTMESNATNVEDFPLSNYAYLIPWEHYNAMPVLHAMLSAEVNVLTAFKEFSIATHQGVQSFGYGALMVPVSKQQQDASSLHRMLSDLSNKWSVPIYATDGGYSTSGIDLGSRNFQPLEERKPIMLIGDGVSGYEAGEVWHLLDQRIGMPITKVRINNFDDIDWSKYNTLVMVSGSYSQLDSADIAKIQRWLEAGNTLIAQRGAVSWAINKGLVNEQLVKKEKPKDEEKKGPVARLPYVDAREHTGKKRVGGAIFEIALDLTHPVAFGYTEATLPVYRNSEVWLAPSKNAYSTVGVYTPDPHIDGFIDDEVLNDLLKKSAPIVVSRVGSGRAILFAENPNFRGSWYGTNKLFMNALFFGPHINVPRE